MKNLRKLLVLIQYVIYALKRMNKPHLGDTVIFDGSEYCLIQGVSNPYWDLFRLSDSHKVKRVHYKSFKLKYPITGRIERFKQSFKFQMRNWFRIDTYNRPLLNRISYR